MPAIKFRGVDFINFDSLLSDDERLVRATARKFIEENASFHLDMHFGQLKALQL